MTLEFSRQIFEKYSHTKFHENPSNGSRVVPFGQTGRQTTGHDEANSLRHCVKMRTGENFLTGCITFQEERNTTDESNITCQDRRRLVPKKRNLKVRQADVVVCFFSKMFGSSTAGSLSKNDWERHSEVVRSQVIRVTNERITNTEKQSQAIPST